ncbi:MULTISPECIES: hypothetical protein [unclassified Spirosoma]|uniref:hypothetical protein n=1 Tax=unclassified Spirosoma TaxID=2621999 RepID=UPI000AFF3093|nr:MULTISPECIES: hypothetical protein [unclassified Spirosoma]
MALKEPVALELVAVGFSFVPFKTAVKVVGNIGFSFSSVQATKEKPNPKKMLARVIALNFIQYNRKMK